MAIHGLDGNSITNINIGGGESATTQPTANANTNTNSNAHFSVSDMLNFFITILLTEIFD